MFFKRESENALAVTQQLLKYLGINFTQSNLREKLTEHHDYPSLLSISDTLNSLKVNNMAIQITSDSINELPTPCIANMVNGDSFFVLIKSVKNEIVELWDYEHGSKSQTIDEFSKFWKGIILLAETTDYSGEKNYEFNKRGETIAKLGVFSIVLMTSFLFFGAIVKFFLLSNPTLAVSLLLFTKFLGFIVCVMLLWHSLDSNHPILKNVCQINQSTNCDSILNSNAASIGGVMTWSELGFFYFTGTCLAVFWGHNTPFILFVVGVLNLCAVPYSVYSVYYQAIIAKKWCVLCLAVQLLFWFEFLIFWFGIGYSTQNTNINIGVNLIDLAFYLTFPIVIWFILKPILKEYLQVPHLNLTLRKFQNNPSYFRYIISSQNEMETIPWEMPILELGLKNVPNTITLVTNPYCSACSEYHSVFESLIEENEDLVNGQIILANSSDANDVRNIFAKHLFAIEASQRNTALSTWFQLPEQNVEVWKKRFSTNLESDVASCIAQKHTDWAKATKIKQTPTFFINGYELPDIYSIEDVKRMATLIFDGQSENTYKL